jgi:hypothetical protein
MSAYSTNLNLEPLIWARLIEGHKGDISPEIARYLLSLEFGENDRESMHILADRSEAGTLTLDEETEFDGYLHIGNLLAVMQSKARVILGEQPLAIAALVNPDLSREVWGARAIAANVAISRRPVTRCLSTSTISSPATSWLRRMTRLMAIPTSPARSWNSLSAGSLLSRSRWTRIWAAPSDCK